jgi:N-acetylmuramoyl-L-alanine amidase
MKTLPFKPALACWCLGIVLALASTAVRATAVAVEGLRLWRAPDHTRMVFDLSAPARHTLMSMDNPARLIIDIDQSRLAAALGQVDVSDTPIRAIRSGVRDGRHLRIVLDLHGGIKPESFLLGPSGEYGNRLVVDLFGTVPRPATPVQAQPRAAAAVAATPAAPPPAKVAEPRAAPVAAPLPRAGTARGRDILIAIDAGHGGEDPGAIGPNRTREKDVVLAISRELEKRLNARPGYRASMIRSGDYYIGLMQRRDMARKMGADLFVSIHADAFTHARARGGSVYALSQGGATSASAAFLAQRENGADLIGGINLGQKDKVLAGVLTDLSMTATLDASLGVGSRVLNSMGRVAHLHKKRVEQAGFAVLKSPDVPSILIETGFISNPQEAERLRTPAYQRSIADAILQGLNDYFMSTPPPGTLVAMSARSGARPSEYVIARGDTLSGIAERYRVSVSDIVRSNSLGAGNDIRAGQTIVIPQS